MPAVAAVPAGAGDVEPDTPVALVDGLGLVALVVGRGLVVGLVGAVARVLAGAPAPSVGLPVGLAVGMGLVGPGLVGLGLVGLGLGEADTARHS